MRIHAFGGLSGVGVVVAALLLAASVHAETVKCQRTIAKESAKFVKTQVKTLQKCEESKVKGKLPALTDCDSEPKVEAEIEKAGSKLKANIEKRCGGADKQCGGDLTGEDGGTALGWPAMCPDFDDTPELQCVLAIGATDCTGIADCLECIGDDLSDQAMELYYAKLEPTDSSTQQELNTCQQTIGKEASKFLLTKSKALQSCWDRRIKGKHADECPDVTAATKITKAESKFLAKACKRCGGADGLCNGIDDFTAAQIGFENDCHDVVVPFGGPSCMQDPVTTLTELVTCVDCVTEYRVDCLDRAQVPQFGAFPAECSPAP